MKTCYHTHSDFSDGKTSMENIVKAAVDNGFEILAMTDHGPVPFPSAWNMPYEKITNYLQEINRLKEKYQDKITLLKGLEVDFLPGFTQINFLKKSLDLDITVGSVHYVNQFADGTPFNIDKSSEVFLRGLKEIFNNDIQQLAQAYYQLVIKMITEDPPDIIAHITLLEKYNNRLGGIINTEESWYRELVKITLYIVSLSDCVMEINARSFYRGLLDELVPPLWVLKYANKLGIPITINGDVHAPEDFTKYWDKAVDYVKAAGYTHTVIFTEKGQRQTVKL